MTQEDYILREIEKIGQMLQGLLARFLSGRNNPAARPGQGFEETTEKLKEEMDFELDRFISMDKTEAMTYLRANSRLNAVNLELMAELLFHLADECDDLNKERLLQCSLLSFEICSEQDHTFSIQREQRIADIREALTNTHKHESN